MRLPFLVLLAFCSAATVHATVVTLGTSQDTSIFANNVNNSDGGGPGLFAGDNGTGSPRRALLEFNLSSIPAGSIITNVQLTLTLGQVGGATTATIGLFDVTQSWGEGTAESGASGIGGTGQGAMASTGDATWDAAFYSSTSPTLWTSPGGDHAATASASLFLGTNTLSTAFTWGSTAQMVADVQGWVNNSSTNDGWELINADESDPNTLYGFYSREWDNAHFGGSSTQVPALQVTYTPAPEPSSSLLAAPAALALLSTRARRRRAG
jgi:hypothetical protein